MAKSLIVTVVVAFAVVGAGAGVLGEVVGVIDGTAGAVVGTAVDTVDSLAHLISNESWIRFLTTYKRNYDEKTAKRKRATWTKVVTNIFNHNKEYKAGKRKYSLGENEFSDMDSEDFMKMMGLMVPTEPRKNPHTFRPPEGIQIPLSRDWRLEGYVTSVKNQGDCGACWAFATAAALEGQNKKKTGDLVDLSIQNLLDCVTANHGCRGGVLDHSYSYVQNNGITNARSYPYTGEVGMCRDEFMSNDVTCNGYADIPRGDEDALLRAVATVGPIAVGIDSHHFSFHYYKGGVYDDPVCSQRVNHAVLLVGYGTENGQDYWLVKNSWGTSWGEEGYIKIARNAGNLCGISNQAAYPIM